MHGRGRVASWGWRGGVAVETITRRGALGQERRSELPEESGGVGRTWAPARYYKERQRTWLT